MLPPSHALRLASSALTFRPARLRGVAVLQSAAEAAGAEVEEEVVALKRWIAEQIDPGGRDSRNRLFQRRSVNRGLANKDGRNWRIPDRKLHPLKLSHLHRAIDHLV